MKIKLKYLSSAIKTLSAITLNKMFGYKSPLLAYILVTNRCNLDCVYCFSNANKKENLDIPLEKIYQIIDQLKKCGTILITITGGEPGLRKDLDKIIDYIIKKGMMVELVTNGLNFEKYLDTIKKVDFLAISVDGSEEIHDKNRGKGSYKLAMKALELAKENNIHVRIHACFSRNTSNSLEDLMEIIKEYDVRANIAIPSIHTDNPSLAFTDDEIREYYRKMKEFKKKGYLISNSYSTLNYISKWPGEFGFVSDKPDPSLPCIPCKRKDFSMYIDATGDAYPCCSVWNKYKFNVFEMGVKKAFKEFQKVTCNTCIIEAEFNLLFKGSFSSIANVAAFGILDRFRGLIEK
jgi:MoaA/NifB/PqqE/SkfB family radical SAM enzyme